MKKLIIFYEYFTPAKSAGGIVRSIRNLVGLISKDFDVYIFTSGYDLGMRTKLLGVPFNEWVDFQNEAQVFYCDKRNTFWEVQKALLDINPAIVYINGLFTPSYVIVPLIAIKMHVPNAKVIIAPRGMLQRGALHGKRLKKSIYLRLFRLFNLDVSVKWHATDRQEFEDIRSLFGLSSKVILAYLALDTPSQKIAKLVHIEKQPYQVNLVYLSLITQKKNLLFLIQSLQRAPSHLQITLEVYGPVKDQSYWRQCQTEVMKLPDNITFQYRGAVNPEDVSSVFQRYHFFAFPTTGENFGHAIYESLVSGCPVIISDKTPWQSLAERKAGWDLPLDSDYFLEAIVKAAELDQKEYEILRIGAQQVAQQYLKDNDFHDQYMRLFDYPSTRWDGLTRVSWW